ncbi:MAG TPA: DUF4153 domain-containing protein [Nocardioidaceae bacterium]|nr:DUF4153 domain-containing protein [Nocardioidaceae bacterium]
MSSIKAKLGILIAVTVALAALTPTLADLVGVRARYAIPVAVLVALGVTQVLARGMTSPLREMTAAAQRMARGDYSRRVTATSRDEVGELARAFNTMAADLEAVDQQRRDLVANVSHELRTPVTALHAVLENLADGVGTPSQETLQAALGQTGRLSRLVGDLLDLSRLDAGITELRLEDLPAGQLLTDAVQQARLAGHPVEYVVQAAPEAVIHGDRARLHQLLANLLDNAGRHSPGGGTVTARASFSADHTQLEVLDEGPGIDPADRALVFERFQSGEHHDGGTGLGLAIARWVVDLHGGSIEVVDTVDGCHIRADIPHTTPVRRPKEKLMAIATASLPVDPLFGQVWPERRADGRPRLLLAALATGLLGALVLFDRDLGLGTFLVFAALAGTVAAGDVELRRHLPALGLCLALGSTVFLRDAEWIVVLCVLAAIAVAVATLVQPRSIGGLVVAALAVPLASLRGMPWLSRSLATSRLPFAMLRTLCLTVILALIFGALFASADAVFATWVDAVLPDVSLGSVPGRFVLFVLLSGVTLSFTYVAVNPPRAAAFDVAARPVRTFEWLIPVAIVDLLFAAFVIAQATVLFGGHDYLERTTGITYADYVHEGFAQMTVATALTLLVVAVAVQTTAREDRTRVRIALGLLCALALVVVGSALYRVHVYEEAYGFTRLRLLVTVFEGWLGLLLVLVLVAGIRMRGSWLPLAAVITGAVALLGLAVLNPDAYIADQNLARLAETGKVDYEYLAGLSTDAWQELQGTPAATECPTGDDWLEWNLGRARCN